MNKEVFLLLLSLIILLLVCIIIYQQVTFKKGTQAKLNKLSNELETILNEQNDGKVMVFTDNPAIMSLAAQINRLLENQQQLKADYRRSESASKKMLANVSHDLKTPMTVILGYLEIIQLQNKDSHPALSKIEQKAEQVVELINQFFSLAKLEAGDTDMELTKLNMNELCREIILDFYELLTKHAFQVEVTIPENTLTAYGNQAAIERILANLITNAIRYGSDGHYLALDLRNDATAIYIDITDKGKGIEKAFANSIFERLFTLEDSRNRDVQGNGLGLTIAKQLALQLGGDLYLESTPSVATTFTLKLRKITY